MRHSHCEQPQLIIHNARVHVVDADNTIEQAIALAGERVLAIGTSAEILALAAPHTRIIDANEASVIPGINDSHCHMWEAGMLMEGIITFGIPSIRELAEEVGR